MNDTARQPAGPPPPGLALDEEVAEKVMGWTQTAGPINDVSAHGYCWLPPGSVVRVQVQPYSQSIAAAWLVVERMRALGWYGYVSWWSASTLPGDTWPPYLASLRHGDTEIDQGGLSPAHAICLAALAAVGQAGPGGTNDTPAR